MRRLCLLPVLVALATGCGGGSGDGDGIDLEGTETGTATGADYEVFASEFSFAPPFLVVSKPGRYTFAIRNDGSVPHNFSVEGVGKTPDAQPGETQTVELTLKAGNYEVLCTLGDHAEQGMTGTLNVLTP